uniref:Ig-like domain-containing protein n=1 Tax=Strigamia maritima TaxID=126957 RepID=T1JH08_STRMM
MWYNRQGKVEESVKYHFFKEEQNVTRLEIDPVEAMDEGEWRCVASGSQGQAVSICHLTLTVPKNYKKPRFLEELSAILSEEGTVSFECKVVGVPSPMLKWFKDGVELKPGDVYKLTGTKSLGTYACVASNFMGSSTSRTELTLEDLQGKRRKRRRKIIPTLPPQFTVALKDADVKIGEEMHLAVTVIVPPEPEICWYKDDDKIVHDGKHRLTQDESGTYNLDVFPVDIRDQGEWRCVAVNNFGHGSTNCNVKIIVPKQYRAPKFIEELRAALSSEGNVSLDCKVVGVPQPTLTWFKDGVELKAGDIYRIMSAGDGTSCLGTYTCQAKNCMGSASSTVGLLAFEDQLKKDKKKEPFQQELSTIEEKSEYSSFATPSYSTDNWDDSKAEMEFSIYETPDITEDEARQIIEAFADQVSEHVTTSNVADLPPLRFIRESAMIGNVLMEAVIIDVPIECCEDVEEMAMRTSTENLETQAGIEELSNTEALVVDIPYDPVDLKEMSDKGQASEQQARAVSPTNQEAILVQAPFQLTDIKSLSDPEYQRMRSSIEEMESFVHEALRIDSPTAMRADVGDIPSQDHPGELKTHAHVGMATLLQTAVVIAPSVLSAVGEVAPPPDDGQRAEVVFDQAAAVQVTAPGKERRDEMAKRERRESTSDEDVGQSDQYDTEADISSIISDADAFDVNEEFAKEETSADNAIEVQIPDIYSPNLQTLTEAFMDDRATPVPPSSHEGVIVEQATGLEHVVSKDVEVQQKMQAELQIYDFEALQVQHTSIQSPSPMSMTDTSSVTLTMADVTISAQSAVEVQSLFKLEGHEEMTDATLGDVRRAEMKETSFKEAVQVQDYHQQTTDDLEGEVSGKLELPRQLTSPAEEVVVAEVVLQTRAQALEVGKWSQELEQTAQEKEVSCLQALIVQEIAELKDSLKEAFEIGSDADTSLADVADISLNQEIVVTSVDATEMSVQAKAQQAATSEKPQIQMELERETLLVEETRILERPILTISQATSQPDIAEERPITPSQAVTVGQDQTFEKTEFLTQDELDVQKAREMLMTPVESVIVLQQQSVDVAIESKIEGKLGQVADQRIASPIQPLTVEKQELVETSSHVETSPLPTTQEAVLVETPSKSPLVIETPTALESTEDFQEQGLKPPTSSQEVALVRVTTPQPSIGIQVPGVAAEMVEGMKMDAHFEELHEWADEVGLRSTSPTEAVVVQDPTLQPEAVLAMDPAVAKVERGELRTGTPTPEAVVQEPPDMHRHIAVSASSYSHETYEDQVAAATEPATGLHESVLQRTRAVKSQDSVETVSDLSISSDSYISAAEDSLGSESEQEAIQDIRDTIRQAMQDISELLEDNKSEGVSGSDRGSSIADEFTDDYQMADSNFVASSLAVESWSFEQERQLVKDDLTPTPRAVDDDGKELSVSPDSQSSDGLYKLKEFAVIEDFAEEVILEAFVQAVSDIVSSDSGFGTRDGCTDRTVSEDWVVTHESGLEEVTIVSKITSAASSDYEDAVSDGEGELRERKLFRLKVKREISPSSGEDEFEDARELRTEDVSDVEEGVIARMDLVSNETGESIIYDLLESEMYETCKMEEMMDLYHKRVDDQGIKTVEVKINEPVLAEGKINEPVLTADDVVLSKEILDIAIRDVTDKRLELSPALHRRLKDQIETEFIEEITEEIIEHIEVTETKLENGFSEKDRSKLLESTTKVFTLAEEEITFAQNENKQVQLVEPATVKEIQLQTVVPEKLEQIAFGIVEDVLHEISTAITEEQKSFATAQEIQVAAAGLENLALEKGEVSKEMEKLDVIGQKADVAKIPEKDDVELTITSHEVEITGKRMEEGVDVMEDILLAQEEIKTEIIYSVLEDKTIEEKVADKQEDTIDELRVIQMEDVGLAHISGDVSELKITKILEKEEVELVITSHDEMASKGLEKGVDTMQDTLLAREETKMEIIYSVSEDKNVIENVADKQEETIDELKEVSLTQIPGDISELKVTKIPDKDDVELVITSHDENIIEKTVETGIDVMEDKQLAQEETKMEIIYKEEEIIQAEIIDELQEVKMEEAALISVDETKVKVAVGNIEDITQSTAETTRVEVEAMATQVKIEGEVMATSDLETFKVTEEKADELVSAKETQVITVTESRIITESEKMTEENVEGFAAQQAIELMSEITSELQELNLDEKHLQITKEEEKVEVEVRKADLLAVATENVEKEIKTVSTDELPQEFLEMAVAEVSDKDKVDVMVLAAGETAAIETLETITEILSEKAEVETALISQTVLSAVETVQMTVLDDRKEINDIEKSTLTESKATEIIELEKLNIAQQSTDKLEEDNHIIEEQEITTVVTEEKIEIADSVQVGEITMAEETMRVASENVIDEQQYTTELEIGDEFKLEEKGSELKIDLNFVAVCETTETAVGVTTSEILPMKVTEDTATETTVVDESRLEVIASETDIFDDLSEDEVTEESQAEIFAAESDEEMVSAAEQVEPTKVEQTEVVETSAVESDEEMVSAAEEVKEVITAVEQVEEIVTVAEQVEIAAVAEQVEIAAVAEQVEIAAVATQIEEIVSTAEQFEEVISAAEQIEEVVSVVEQVEEIISTAEKDKKITFAPEQVVQVISSTEKVEEIIDTTEQAETIISAVEQIEEIVSAVEKEKEVVFAAELVKEMASVTDQLEEIVSTAEEQVEVVTAAEQIEEMVSFVEKEKEVVFAAELVKEMASVTDQVEEIVSTAEEQVEVVTAAEQIEEIVSLVEKEKEVVLAAEQVKEMAFVTDQVEEIVSTAEEQVEVVTAAEEIEEIVSLVEKEKEVVLAAEHVRELASVTDQLEEIVSTTEQAEEIISAAEQIEEIVCAVEIGKEVVFAAEEVKEIVSVAEHVEEIVSITEKSEEIVKAAKQVEEMVSTVLIEQTQIEKIEIIESSTAESDDEMLSATEQLEEIKVEQTSILESDDEMLSAAEEIEVVDLSRVEQVTRVETYAQTLVASLFIEAKEILKKDIKTEKLEILSEVKVKEMVIEQKVSEIELKDKEENDENKMILRSAENVAVEVLQSLFESTYVEIEKLAESETNVAVEIVDAVATEVSVPMVVEEVTEIMGKQTDTAEAKAKEEIKAETLSVQDITQVCLFPEENIIDQEIQEFAKEKVEETVSEVIGNLLEVQTDVTQVILPKEETILQPTQESVIALVSENAELIITAETIEEITPKIQKEPMQVVLSSSETTILQETSESLNALTEDISEQTIADTSEQSQPKVEESSVLVIAAPVTEEIPHGLSEIVNDETNLATTAFVADETVEKQTLELISKFELKEVVATELEVTKIPEKFAERMLSTIFGEAICAAETNEAETIKVGEILAEHKNDIISTIEESEVQILSAAVVIEEEPQQEAVTEIENKIHEELEINTANICADKVLSTFFEATTSLVSQFVFESIIQQQKTDVIDDLNTENAIPVVATVNEETKPQVVEIKPEIVSSEIQEGTEILIKSAEKCAQKMFKEIFEEIEDNATVVDVNEKILDEEKIKLVEVKQPVVLAASIENVTEEELENVEKDKTESELKVIEQLLEPILKASILTADVAYLEEHPQQVVVESFQLGDKKQEVVSDSQIVCHEAIVVDQLIESDTEKFDHQTYKNLPQLEIANVSLSEVQHLELLDVKDSEVELLTYTAAEVIEESLVNISNKKQETDKVQSEATIKLSTKTDISKDEDDVNAFIYFLKTI